MFTDGPHHWAALKAFRDKPNTKEHDAKQGKSIAFEVPGIAVFEKLKRSEQAVLRYDRRQW
jgi:hypothetical protein